MWIKHLLFAVIVAAVSYWAANLAAQIGIFRHVYNHAPGPCVVLSSVEHGSEDIELLPNGLAFISSGFLVPSVIIKYGEIPGRIYLFNLSRPSSPPKELRIVADEKYKLISPCGLGLWQDSKTGVIYVYITSHQPTMNVDKFRFDETRLTLTHLRRINDPNFIQLDDIAIIGEDQFYFSNFYHSFIIAELLLGTNWGSIGYYDGTGSVLIDKGLASPTGIVVSLDKKFVFVGHSRNQSVRVYKKRSVNALSFSHEIGINTCADNLYIDWKTGDLWLAGHPILYKTVQYIGGQTDVSPSQVIKIKLDGDAQPVNIEEIYSNNGTEFSASSVAVVRGNRLLVGSITSHVLLCEIK